MQIFSINKKNEQCKFTGYKLGYDDATKAARQLIRENLLSNAMPNYRYHRISYRYHLNSAKGDFRMGKFLSRLLKEPSVNHELLRGLDIRNFKAIQDDAYRGEMLFEKTACLKDLKEAGIKRIISLARGNQAIMKACQENELEYKRFIIDHDFWSQPVFDSEKSFLLDKKNLFGKDFDMSEEKEVYRLSARQFINNFIEFINAISEGNFYIGCDFGTYKTDDALLLIQYFNPKNKQLNIITPPNLEYKLRRMMNLYKNLTENDKKKLGWTPDFEKNFIEKVLTELKNYG